jgi:hypothetical protein
MRHMAMRSVAAHRIRSGARGLVTRCWKKRKGPVVSYAITPATRSSPCAVSRASLEGQGMNPMPLSAQRAWYLASQSWLAHTSLMETWKCRPVHLRRYLRLGKLGFSRLMDRAGLGDHKQALFLTRAQAKRLLRYHFVMLYEHKPAPPGTPGRYPRGVRDRSLRRSVHPRL